MLGGLFIYPNLDKEGKNPYHFTSKQTIVYQLLPLLSKVFIVPAFAGGLINFYFKEIILVTFRTCLPGFCPGI